MTKVKICGLKRECDIDYVNEACPDYIGFVFAKSKRQVTPEQAKVLKARLDKGILAVGVFVNEEIEFIISLVKEGIIDVIQLHGGEDNAYISKLKAITQASIIKAVNPQNDYNYTADFLLYDNAGGGTGQAFDWRLLNKPNKPFFLAGGISLDNIDQALKTVKPFAIDISSGVETDGFKDRQKILDIVGRIRNE